MFICCTICKGNAISQVITFTDAKIYRQNKLLFRNLLVCTAIFQPQTLIFLYICGGGNCSVFRERRFKFRNGEFLTNEQQND